MLTAAFVHFCNTARSSDRRPLSSNADIDQTSPNEAMIALAGPLAEQRYRPVTSARRRVLWREAWRDDRANALKHAEICGADIAQFGRQVRWCVSTGRRSSAWQRPCRSAAR